MNRRGSVVRRLVEVGVGPPVDLGNSLLSVTEVAGDPKDHRECDRGDRAESRH